MNPKQQSNADILSYLYCFIGVFLFSTTELAGKLASVSISPVVTTIFRFFIGSASLLPIAFFQARRSKTRISFSDILSIIYPGVINVVGAMLFLQYAVHYGKASTSAMLISSNPIFVAIFAFLILKEKLSPAKIIGILIGLVGVIFVIRGEDHLNAEVINPFLGLFFGVLATIFFGLYTVLAKKTIIKYGNVFFNTLSFAGGALALLIIAPLLNLDFSFHITASNILILIYMGTFITGLAYIVFFAGLQNIPAANGSIFFFFKPVLAVLFAYFLLNERITIQQIVGVIIVIAGIYITNLQGKQGTTKEKPT